MLHSSRLFLIQVITILLLGACATMPQDFEQPSISVTSFIPTGATGISPQFEIVLHITNPNRNPLELQGISYTINLDGNKVMSGVANDLPVIEPYGEADVKLNARANLLGGFKLITGLMEEAKKHIDYEFKAKLDIGRFSPRIEVSKKGKL